MTDQTGSVAESLLRFMDVTQDVMNRAGRPAFAEVCCCGGSVEIGKDVPPAERRRLTGTFHARHALCTGPRTQNGADDD